MSNELRSQGTELFFLDTTIKKIPNLADIGEHGPQADDIETTNLDSLAKEFLTGLADNGELPLQLNLDPTSLVHQRLSALAGTGQRLTFCMCLSDGTDPPTVTSGALVIPVVTGRTSFVFSASVKSFRKAFKANDASRVTCALRISGAIAEHWKTP